MQPNDNEETLEHSVKPQKSRVLVSRIYGINFDCTKFRMTCDINSQ